MANPYAASDSAQDTLDRVNRRVAGDIRSHVRRIHPAPSSPSSHHSVASAEWTALIDTYTTLASLAVSDERDLYHNAEHYVVSVLLGGGAAPQQDSGKASDHSTIWERDEVVVRIIIEEGKPNLIARTMMDVWALIEPTNVLQASAAARKMLIASGLLLRVSVMALETLQTLDVRNLLTHCKQVLSSTPFGQPLPVSVDGLQLLLSQQGTVIAYLAHLIHKMEKLRTEDIIFEGLMDLQLVPLVLQHAEWAYPLLSSPQFPELVGQLSSKASAVQRGGAGEEGLGSYLHAFAGTMLLDFPSNYVIFFVSLLESEHGKAAWAQLFPDRPTKKRFVDVMEPMTRLMMPGAMISADLRKACRALTDTILRFK